MPFFVTIIVFILVNYTAMRLHGAVPAEWMTVMSVMTRFLLSWESVGFSCCCDHVINPVPSIFKEGGWVQSPSNVGSQRCVGALWSICHTCVVPPALHSRSASCCLYVAACNLCLPHQGPHGFGCRLCCQQWHKSDRQNASSVLLYKCCGSLM